MENAQLIITDNAITSTTDLAQAKALELAKQYNVFARQTALGVIAMAEVVYQAKEAGTVCYAEFCKFLKYNENDTMLSKLRKIGEKTAMLKKHADALPGNWTTLYLLAKEDTLKVQKLLDNHLIHPMSKAKDIKDLLGIEQSKNTASTKKMEVIETNEHQMVIKLANLPSVEDKAKIASFLFQLRQMKAQVAYSHSLVDFFE